MHGSLRNGLQVLLLCLAVGSVSAQGTDSTSRRSDLVIGGYVKSLQALYFAEGLNPMVSLSQLHHRLNLDWTFSTQWRIQAGIRNRILWGDYLRLVPDRGQALDGQAGRADLSALWVTRPSFVIHSVVDRLSLEWQSAKWSVRAGRQRINWGLHPIWNPNDLFNAYSFLDFDYEERPGTDGVRVRYFLSGLSVVEAAWASGPDGSPDTYAALFRTNTHGYDLQFLAGRAGHDLVAGTGWAGHIGDAGFKGEVTWFRTTGDRPDSLSTLSVALSADRTFKDNWYASVGLLYQSNPGFTGRLEDFSSGAILGARALMPYQFSWYASATKGFSPITQASLAIVYSPKNASLVLLPSFSQNLAPNLDLDLFIQSFFAGDRSSYASQAQAFFMRLRWSY